MNAAQAITYPPRSFQGYSCDLCGSEAHDTLIQSYRSMTSDSRLTDIGLHKVACRGCGLARNLHSLDEAELSSYYQDDYTHNSRAEHSFLIDGVWRTRSEYIHEWMMTLLVPLNLSRETTKVMEVGCGSGELLRHFDFHHKSGIEYNRQAALQAAVRGLDVRHGAYWDIDSQFDLIVSFGVLEHVASPSDFLATLRRALTPGGFLLLGQPFQDTPSYDIFFLDHLHHFHLHHLDLYFAKTGLKEVARSVGYGPITNFSLHLLSADAAPEEASTEWLPSTRWDLEELHAQFAALDDFLAKQPTGSEVYAYGSGECLKLFEANTRLAQYLSGILDDFAEEADRLESIPEEKAACFVLTLHPIYQDKVLQQIRRRFSDAPVYSVQRSTLL